MFYGISHSQNPFVLGRYLLLKTYNYNKQKSSSIKTMNSAAKNIDTTPTVYFNVCNKMGRLLPTLIGNRCSTVLDIVCGFKQHQMKFSHLLVRHKAEKKSLHKRCARSRKSRMLAARTGSTGLERIDWRKIRKIRISGFNLAPALRSGRK